MEWMLMAAAVLVSIWLIVGGLVKMQRINTADPQVAFVQGVVRKLGKRGFLMTEVLLTIHAEESAVQVRCLLPGLRRPQLTDLVPVFWQQGEDEAVAARTLRNGQMMFIVGFVLLALTALWYMLL